MPYPRGAARAITSANTSVKTTRTARGQRVSDQYALAERSRRAYDSTMSICGTAPRRRLRKRPRVGVGLSCSSAASCRRRYQMGRDADTRAIRRAAAVSLLRCVRLRLRRGATKLSQPSRGCISTHGVEDKPKLRNVALKLQVVPVDAPRLLLRLPSLPHGTRLTLRSLVSELLLVSTPPSRRRAAVRDPPGVPTDATWGHGGAHAI